MQNLECISVNRNTCPVCEHATFRKLPVPGHWIDNGVFAPYRASFSLSRCARCTFVFVNPRPNDTLLEKFYRGPSYSCHRANQSRTVRDKADLLLRKLTARGSGRRLLDFGCGGGWFLKYAGEKGFTVTGYDVGDEGLRACRAQGFRVTNDLDQLEPYSFDAIVLNHVFEHLTDPGATLRRLSSLLDTSGRFFIEVPNSASLRARMSHPALSRFLGFDERYRAYPIHLSYFSAKTLSRILERQGLEVESVETYGLGIDELLLDNGWRTEAYGDNESPAKLTRKSSTQPPVRQKLKHLAKQAFFNARLGENLLAIARVR